MINIPTHVTWWRHYMETTLVLLVLHEVCPMVTLKSYTINGRVSGYLIRCDSTALYWWGTCWSMPNDALITNLGQYRKQLCDINTLLVWDLNRTAVAMANPGCSCVHFSGISTCRKTSRETDLHSQHPPIPTLYKISLPVYVIVTNKRFQPLTTTWYNSLVLPYSLLKI